jgi:hypothetical protein
MTNLVYNSELDKVLDGVPFDLGRFPALRHLKIEWRKSCQDDPALFRFLIRLLSMSSSNGIEVLEIKNTWYGVEVEYGKNLPNAEWSRLNQLLTSQTFGSLRNATVSGMLTIGGQRLAPETEL